MNTTTPTDEQVERAAKAIAPMYLVGGHSRDIARVALTAALAAAGAPEPAKVRSLGERLIDEMRAIYHNHAHYTAAVDAANRCAEAVREAAAKVAQDSIRSKLPVAIAATIRAMDLSAVRLPGEEEP